ncbi:hypothetical protein GCM10022207_33900 [Streptomyces lannensis]|uniref:Uncharacterized protein n=1 Tax=Streptomyces lannensis TaxID=766498 RepID=A0ABP7K5P9_9ACTN
MRSAAPLCWSGRLGRANSAPRRGGPASVCPQDDMRKGANPPRTYPTPDHPTSIRLIARAVVDASAPLPTALPCGNAVPDLGVGLP